jgi:Carboxypeptidase regulatory-like domain
MTRLALVFAGRQTAVAAVRSRAVALTLGIALGVSGCSAPRSSAPTAPTPVSIATTAATHLLGVVEDSAFRPLTGVRVEVADGPQAGASAISTDHGSFEISGTSTGSVTLRATKDGFSTAKQNASWRAASDRQLVTMILEPLGPSLGIEPGNYTISVTADRATSRDGAAACSGFPDAFLTRSYTATIASDPTHPRSLFQATLQLNNPAPFITSMGFGLGIAGNAVGFTIDGPAISEVLPGYTYLEITGSAPTDLPPTSTGSGIGIPFSGSFVYCALKSPMGINNNCFLAPADQRIAYAQCLSTHAVMVLSKR